MGTSMSRLLFKQEAIVTEFSSLWDISAIDIDGNQIERLGSLVPNKKVVLVVNVASKWGLTDKNY